MEYTGDGARVGEQGRGRRRRSPRAARPPRPGSRPGDVITKVDGQRVHSGEELIVKIRAHRPGDRLELDPEARRQGADRDADARAPRAATADRAGPRAVGRGRTGHGLRGGLPLTHEVRTGVPWHRRPDHVDARGPRRAQDDSRSCKVFNDIGALELRDARRPRRARLRPGQASEGHPGRHRSSSARSGSSPTAPSRTSAANWARSSRTSSSRTSTPRRSSASSWTTRS